MKEKRAQHRYRKALIRELHGEWWRCFWTWPLGHHYVGRECEFCDRPISVSFRDVADLELLYERRLDISRYSLNDADVVKTLPPRVVSAAKAYYGKTA